MGLTGTNLCLSKVLTGKWYDDGLLNLQKENMTIHYSDTSLYYQLANIIQEL